MRYPSPAPIGCSRLAFQQGQIPATAEIAGRASGSRGMQSFDVVIAGGAAMGSSVAYHLLAEPAFRGRVLVVEKDPTYRRSASALSAASIRQQFSTAVNIRISLYGIAFLRGIGEHLAVDGERPEIGLQGGRISLCRRARPAPRCWRENQALQKRGRAPTSRFSTRPALAQPLPLARHGGPRLRDAGAARARAGSTAGACCRPSAARRARSEPSTAPARSSAVERDGGRITAVTPGRRQRASPAARSSIAPERAAPRWRRWPASTFPSWPSAAPSSASPAASGSTASRSSSTRPAFGAGRRATVSSAASRRKRAKTTRTGMTTIRRPRRSTGRSSRSASGRRSPHRVPAFEADPAGPRLGGALRHVPPRPQRHRRARRRARQFLSLQRLLGPRPAAVPGRRAGPRRAHRARPLSRASTCRISATSA